MQNYQYQHIVDNSPELAVTRKVQVSDLVKLRDEIDKLIEAAPSTIDWSYKVQPPIILKKDSTNAPAYVPAEPTVGSYAGWLLFHGVENVIKDSWAKACNVSRYNDKECRSPNFEKFDDETFIAKEQWANDTATKAELEELQNRIIANFACQKDVDGNELRGPEDFKRVRDQLVSVMERIKNKSRKS